MTGFDENEAQKAMIRPKPSNIGMMQSQDDPTRLKRIVAAFDIDSVSSVVWSCRAEAVNPVCRPSPVACRVAVAFWRKSIKQRVLFVHQCTLPLRDHIFAASQWSVIRRVSKCEKTTKLDWPINFVSG